MILLTIPGHWYISSSLSVEDIFVQLRNQLSSYDILSVDPTCSQRLAFTITSEFILEVNEVNEVNEVEVEVDKAMDIFHTLNLSLFLSDGLPILGMNTRVA